MSLYSYLAIARQARKHLRMISCFFDLMSCSSLNLFLLSHLVRKFPLRNHSQEQILVGIQQDP